jgi:hypothetical protein
MLTAVFQFFRVNAPSIMNKEWSLTQENFDALLLWLDPNREQAGQ